MDIFLRINHLRKQKGITLSFIEKSMHAYRGKLTDLKNRKTTLNEYELQIISSILETTPAYLLGNTDDPNPPGRKKEPPAVSGEPIGPAKRELLALIDTLPEKDLDVLLEVYKATLKLKNQ